MVSRLAIAVISTLILFILLFMFIDKILLYRYNEINLDKRFRPPSLDNILGTDSLGRDMFSRLLYGFRHSLSISIIAIAISAVIGLFMGIFSALFKQIQIIIDTIYIFINTVPAILIATVIAFVSGSGHHVIIIAIVLRLLPTFYRIIKTMALVIVLQPYIESVRAIGAPMSYILINYVAREALPTIFILSIHSFSEALSIEISLSFIGLGIQPPTPSMGNIFAEDIRYIMIAPYLILSPIILVLITIFIADIIREKIELHMRRNTFL